jgi:hypothetical protein
MNYVEENLMYVNQERWGFGGAFANEGGEESTTEVVLILVPEATKRNKRHYSTIMTVLICRMV